LASLKAISENIRDINRGIDIFRAIDFKEFIYTFYIAAHRYSIKMYASVNMKNQFMTFSKT
jgi:hypothetical protein